MARRSFRLGSSRALDARPDTAAEPHELPPHHLVTHGVIVGMTGSGKTGLALVMAEEALRSKVPVLAVDVKGDVANLLLAFPELSASSFLPWVDADAAARDEKTPAEVAEALAKSQRDGLAKWSLGAEDTRAFRASIAPRLITPGSTAGEPLHVLSSLEAPTTRWDDDEETSRETLAAAISLVLRLVERDADPTRSREHVLLSHLAERRLRAGKGAPLTGLLEDLAKPPLTHVGALAVDDFLPPKERLSLAQDLNTLLASTTFASWRQGTALDLRAWFAARPDGRTPLVILSVAHLDDAERSLVLGLLFEQLLAWVRSLPGSSDLRALVLFDEVYGFLPPHPNNPPTKRPLLALLKQARAFGVGLLLATQNPMDLDYKALSNAGVWFVGRLQTDADRERVVEGLAGQNELEPSRLAELLKNLPPRTFFSRDVHAKPVAALLETRAALSWLRGPMTRQELKRVYATLAPREAVVAPAVEAPKPALTEAPAGEREAAGETLAIPLTRPIAIATATAGPAVPEGWRSYHGPAPARELTTWRYTPWVAGKFLAHVREPKLGLTIERVRFFAAPLGPDGKPQTDRAVDLEPAWVTHAAVSGAQYDPVPEYLRKRAGAQNAEKALKDHAYRSLEVKVAVHPELALAQADDEARDAFVARVDAEARRKAEEAERAVRAKRAAKLAKLQEDVASARKGLAAAEAGVQRAPGGVETLIAGVFGGKSSARQAESKRTKAETRLDRAAEELRDAEGKLRAAAAEVEAEIEALRREAALASKGIEQRVLAVKKGDVDLLEVGIAWAVH